jgi:hypothetical protein
MPALIGAPHMAKSRKSDDGQEKPVSVRIDPELVELAKPHMRQHRLTLTAFVRESVIERLKSLGAWPPKEEAEE